MVTRPAMAPVLVDKQHHVDAVALHLAQQRVEWFGVGDEHRRAHDIWALGVATAVGRVIRFLHKVFQVDPRR